MLARLPLLHPEGLREYTGDGPADPLRRIVKQRSSMVKRRAAVFHRLDAQLELLGPGWYDALGTDYGNATLHFLARYADPNAVIRLGPSPFGPVPAPLLPRPLARGQGRANCSPPPTQSLAAVGRRRDGLRRARRRHRRRGRAGAGAHRADRRTWTSGSRTCTPRPTRPDHPLTAPASGRSWPRSSPAGSATRTGSPAWPRSAPTPAWSPRSTSPATGRPAPAASPKPATRCCASRSGWPPNRPARPTPNSPRKYVRLMTADRHHDSAICHIATILLTRIAACRRAGQPYVNPRRRRHPAHQGRRPTHRHGTPPGRPQEERHGQLPPAPPSTRRDREPQKSLSAPTSRPAEHQPKPPQAA